MNEEILAIIPARSGSKGLKDKNIKKLNGKPLISYTIEAALKSEIFADILVSTDSEEYKRIAETYGAWVPFLRSRELSEDTTRTSEVIENVLLELEKMGKKYDSFMVLQPTSPLRNEDDIKAAAQLFFEKDANSVVSMCECEHSPLWTRVLHSDYCLDGFLSNLKEVRRQDLKKFYRLNGAIYLVKTDYFIRYRDYYKSKSYAFIMDRSRSVDIDNIDDFRYVEFLMNNRSASSNFNLK